MMKAFEFTIIASGLDPFADDFENRFFEAGCDDATISFQKGVILLDFTREQASFGAAVKSAIANIEAAGACVLRVEPDHLVSLADIAKRSGLTKAAISLYAKGDRREDFPCPVACLTSNHALWDWADVASWLYVKGTVAEEICTQARFVRSMNYDLESRILSEKNSYCDAAA
ncbi:hypothetical protein G3T14_09785 [Methylobacterium sp. BTF04]|uniref:helix-turn-helix transcriptional regulator n=1 Tax=Methylobacterium sp. BTF04 TaxID=2708300 RepID=UPI0013CFA4E9|nr:hypothetical protein [Methylobacterium sp. BTF04]NEU12424.1 hypothetical protein [Methylobacterium sp. BTF04]